jgi:Fe-S cluster assembly protein SufD
MMQLDDSAALNYANIQLLSDSYWQIGHLESIVGRNAQFRSLGVSVGGSYARTLTTSTLAGEGGASELMSAYIATDDQVKDMRTIQTHSARHTVSNLLFTGIAGGRSSTVYSGLIEIKPGAKGSNALQTNRNLILSEQAKADSVPNLTIEENDVHCNHASSTGPIDPEQIYYLESRGIDTDTARWLIASGFFSDIYSKNPVAGSTGFISATIEQRLSELEKG